MVFMVQGLDHVRRQFLDVGCGVIFDKLYEFHARDDEGIRRG